MFRDVLMKAGIVPSFASRKCLKSVVLYQLVTHAAPLFHLLIQLWVSFALSVMLMLRIVERLPAMTVGFQTCAKVP